MNDTVLQLHSSTVKPGWQTTEFWLSSAAKLIGILFAAGILGSGTTAECIAGISAVVLSSLGYTVTRGMVKSGAAMLLIVVAMQPACAITKSSVSEVGHVIVECTKADSPRIIATVVDLGVQAALSAIDEAMIDWSALETSAWAQGKEVGGCALATFVAALNEKAPATQGLLAMPDHGQEALARLSARWGGVEWRTAP